MRTGVLGAVAVAVVVRGIACRWTTVVSWFAWCSSFFFFFVYVVSDTTRHDRGRNDDDPPENDNPGTSRALVLHAIIYVLHLAWKFSYGILE